MLTIDWTAVGAIASLIASTLALILATAQIVWNRRHRPTLDLTVEQENPWVRFPDDHPNSVWLRAKVENLGHAEARNVRAVVTDRTGIQLDPSALHWVSLPWGRRTHKGHSHPEVRDTAPVVNLLPGLSDLVDLISYDWEKGEHDLDLDCDRPRGFPLKRNPPRGSSSSRS
jgi:hypothetical protein